MPESHLRLESPVPKRISSSGTTSHNCNRDLWPNNTIKGLRLEHNNGVQCLRSSGTEVIGLQPSSSSVPRAAVHRPNHSSTVSGGKKATISKLSVLIILLTWSSFIQILFKVFSYICQQEANALRVLKHKMWFKSLKCYYRHKIGYDQFQSQDVSTSIKYPYLRIHVLEMFLQTFFPGTFFFFFFFFTLNGYRSSVSQWRCVEVSRFGVKCITLTFRKDITSNVSFLSTFLY